MANIEIGHFFVSNRLTDQRNVIMFGIVGKLVVF